MKIKIKDRVYEKSNSYNFMEAIEILKNKCNAIYDSNNKIWIVEPSIRNFQTLMPIINTREFLNYFKSLLSKKKKSKKQLSSKFDFLYPFQQEAVNKIINSKYKGFLLSLEQGLGKTLTSLCASQSYNSNNVWIVAPASLLNQWKDEIINWMKSNDIQIYNGTKIKREKLYMNKVKWNIISYETLRNDFEKNKALQNNIINGFMIFDEATKLKNKKTKLYKSFKKICNISNYKLFMTGTPINNALSDMDNIIKLINTKITGNINNYIVWGQETFGYGWNARIINVIQGYKNIDKYIEKIKPIYIRKTKTEVAPDLPKKNIITVKVEQTIAHEKLAKQIMQYLTPFTGFTLLQLLDTGIENLKTSKSENSELLDYPKTFNNPKIEVLKNLISEINNQVLIFSRFKESCYNIVEQLEKEYPNLKIAVITSETKNKDDIANKFRNKEIDIVVATETWAKGISFPDIDYLINYDVSASFEMYFQKQDRIHRINSTSPKFIYNLVGNVVELHIMDLLKEKVELAEQITEGKGGIISESNIRDEVIKKLGWNRL